MLLQRVSHNVRTSGTVPILTYLVDTRHRTYRSKFQTSKSPYSTPSKMSLTQAEMIAKNEAMWDFLIKAKKETPLSYFDGYGQFFEDDAVVYLTGMVQPPCIGKAGAVESIKALHGYWGMIKRRVTVSAVATDIPNTVIFGMDNDLRIADQVLEHFHELEVVTFSEKGLIKEYKLYCDPTPVMGILQPKA